MSYHSRRAEASPTLAIHPLIGHRPIAYLHPSCLVHCIHRLPRLFTTIDCRRHLHHRKKKSHRRAAQGADRTGGKPCCCGDADDDDGGNAGLTLAVAAGPDRVSRSGTGCGTGSRVRWGLVRER